MNQFITYRDSDKFGKLQYYICQRKYPHFTGRIAERPEKIVIDAIPISGYNLWIVFAGTLSGNRIPVMDKVDEEILSVMDEMSRWYLSNRINVDDKRFKKFKINVTGSTQ